MFTFEKDLEVYSLWKAVSEWGVPFVGYLIHCQRTQYCLMNPSGCGKEAQDQICGDSHGADSADITVGLSTKYFDSAVRAMSTSTPGISRAT